MPFAPNSGQYRATGASYASGPRSTSAWTTVAATPLPADQTLISVSPVIGRPFAGIGEAGRGVYDGLAVLVRRHLDTGLLAGRHELIQQVLDGLLGRRVQG